MRKNSIKLKRLFCLKIIDWTIETNIRPLRKGDDTSSCVSSTTMLCIECVGVYPKFITEQVLYAYFHANKTGERKVILEHVGEFSTRKNRSGYSGFIPHDLLPSLLIAIQEQKIRYLVFVGRYEKGGYSNIRRCEFTDEFDLENYS